VDHVLLENSKIRMIYSMPSSCLQKVKFAVSEFKSQILFGAIVAILLAVSLAVGTVTLAPSLIGGTNGSGSNGQNGATSYLGPTSSLNIYLTDPPGSGSASFKYILVNVSSVVLRYQGNVSTRAPKNEFVFNVPAGKGTNVNLTSLSGSGLLLGSTKMPAGNVTAVVFNINGSRAFFSDGSSEQLKIVANGKLMVPINFTVSASGSVDLTISITPSMIHISQGQDVLRPVILARAVEMSSSGTRTTSAETSEG
jgi:Domain of unknown function (DUF4382)